MKLNMMKKIVYALIFLFGIGFTVIFLDDSTAQIICVFSLLFLAAWLLVKGIQISKVSELISIIGAQMVPVLTQIFESSLFAQEITKYYNFVLQFFVEITKIESNYQVGCQTGVAVTFWILFVIGLLLYSKKDATAIETEKEVGGKEFEQENYNQKCQMFCKVLRQRLEAINRENNWNEDFFTPIKAEIEMDVNGEPKKKFNDLLKCLKNNRGKRKIFLVLGDPGAGKSVSSRKLCLE